LEDAGCLSLTLASIIIILLFYVDDILLMTKSPYDLGKQLIILNDLCSSKGMIVNIEKTKVMIIKSKMITYDAFVTISWRKCLHTSILESISTTSSIGTIALKKG
jgi:hypothetical protein